MSYNEESIKELLIEFRNDFDKFPLSIQRKIIHEYETSNPPMEQRCLSQELTMHRLDSMLSFRECIRDNVQRYDLLIFAMMYYYIHHYSL